jgi:hypothetical protein
MRLFTQLCTLYVVRNVLNVPVPLLEAAIATGEKYWTIAIE